MSDERTWTAMRDRTPHENLRALMRHVDVETPTAEIIRIAFIRIPGLGPGDESTVERIREDFAREHAVARAQRWLATQDEPPTITVPDRRTIPADTDGEVHPAEVRAVVAHRHSAREARTCENPGGVIDCSGPDDPGYRCPSCDQQRQREAAIIDDLLTTVTREQMDEARLLTATSDEAQSTESDADDADSTAMTSADETAASTDETANRTEQPRNDEQNPSPQTEGQSALDAFASGDGGSHA